MFLIDFECVQACNLHCRPETLAKGILSFPGDTDVYWRREKIPKQVIYKNHPKTPRR